MGRFIEAKVDLDKILSEYPDRKSTELDALYLYCICHLGNKYTKDMDGYIKMLEHNCAVELDSNPENLQTPPGIIKPVKEDSKKKKKRPKPVPKNYDPSKTPDPGIILD